MTSLPLDGTWTRYGFRDDPYYRLQLPVASLSRQLFVGREADRRRLRATILDNPTGKTMVQGSPGVGKTSLVNVVQQDLYEEGKRFPLVAVVETAAGMAREAFLLTTLSAVVESCRQLCAGQPILATTEFRSAEAAVTRTLHTARTVSMGASAAGLLSGTVNEALVQSSPLGVTAPTLLGFLNEMVKLLRRELGVHGLIVPVNNLDAMSESEALDVLNTVRDSCNGVLDTHWVFVAGEGLMESIELDPRGRRVSESFSGSPIALESLAWDEMLVALDRRRRIFALDEANPPALPISERVTRLIFDAGARELRFTFKRASEIAQDFSQQYPSARDVPDGFALRLLDAWATRQLRRRPLTEREQQVFEVLVEQGTLRAKENKRAGVKTQQQLSQLLGVLVKKGFARKHRDVDGRPAGYAPSPAVRITEEMARLREAARREIAVP